MTVGMRERLRGQPLTVLVLVVIGWVGIRTFTWQPPEAKLDLLLGREVSEKPGPQASDPVIEMSRAPGFAPISYPPPYGVRYSSAYAADFPLSNGWSSLPAYGARAIRRYMIASAPYRAPYGPGMAPPPYYADDPAAGFGPPPTDNRYLLPGAEPLPHLGGQSTAQAPTPVPLSPGLAEGKVDRWSADAWMLVRKEGRASFSGGQPIYGGSQAGAVLRYRLAPGNAHRPLAYLRTSQAMGRIPESELALGLGARPFASVPIMLAAEARAFRNGRKTQFRPAALAYTELPPFRLPFGMTGEAYLQGGYVAGDFKTGFVDGQLRVERPLLSLAGRDIRVGGGLWGGAQKGAKRLDIGPGMSADLVVMGRPSRVSMDWRFRVLGDAEPGSGPAMTLSTGF